jgi:hypothetical protein
MNNGSIPSLWPVRNERRHTAQVRDISKIHERFHAIESTLSYLVTKIDEITNNSKLLRDVTSPPGLCNEDHDLENRVARLETLLVCAPPEHVQPSLSKVLDQLVLHQIQEEKVVEDEPDIELTPDRPNKDAVMVNLEAYHEPECTIAPKCLNKDLDEQGSSFNQGAAEDLLTQARHIAESIKEEANKLQQAQKLDEYSRLIDERFSDLIASVPKRPHTNLTRDNFEKKYGDMHRHFIWQNMCRRHFGETGDPLAKPDMVLDIADIIHSLWKVQPLTSSS